MRYKTEGGIRTGVLKGIFPLHGVTEALRRHEGAGPLVGVWGEPDPHDFEFPPSPPAFAKASAGRPALGLGSK